MPSLRFGTISSGTAINLTADYAGLGIAIRYPPGMSVADIIDALRQVGHAIQYEPIDGKPPIAPDYCKSGR